MKQLKITALVFSLVIVSSCGTKETKDETKSLKQANLVTLTAEQVKNAEVTLGKPKIERIGLTLFANGTIEVPPQNKTVISAQLGGFITSLNVLDGMSVMKGQTLLTVEHPDLIQLQQDYLELVSNLEYLHAESDRQRKLSVQEAGTLKNYQQAKATYAAALARKSGLKAKLQLAGVNVEKLNEGDLQKTIAIKAPFTGVVTKVAVDVGGYANPTDHLLELIDLKHAHAEVIVFEKDVKYLRIGQKVKLAFTTLADSLDARIFLIGREIAKDRTVKVHCHLVRERSEIAPGSYFKAHIFTGEKEAVCVPSEAIVELNGKSVVFYESIQNGGGKTYFPQEVHVLSSENERTAIEFVGKQRSLSEALVIKGAYDILAAYLMQAQGNE